MATHLPKGTAESVLERAQRFASIPLDWPEDTQTVLQSLLKEAAQKVVVLDDDPTGTQTVHGIPVLTEWSVTSLEAELKNDLPAFYLLTNSRSLPLHEAQAINAEIGRNLLAAAHHTQRRYVVVSRSDSTLRGHFPGEVEALISGMWQAPDALLLIPFFLEGGRYTIDDIHYVADGERLVPAGETPFARDAAFSFQSSNLRSWVEEKTAGRISAHEVASISLEDIRLGGPERIKDGLMMLTGGGVCVVNAVSMRDLEVFALGLLKAEREGKRFIYRTAASFVPVRAGIAPRPLLGTSELRLSGQGGGLIVVGSHVPITSAQVAALQAENRLESLEVRVKALLDDTCRNAEISRVSLAAERFIAGDEDVMIYTSREPVSGHDAESSLRIGQRISRALIDIVRDLSTKPRYLIAKGGITSSDIATLALGVKRAMVLGQLLPGVPVWRLGDESRYPGLSYVVFPGNVGRPQSLVEVVTALR